MSGGELKVDQYIIDTHVEVIKGGLDNYDWSKGGANSDMKSTITARAKSYEAFQKAYACIGIYETAILKEVSDMKKMGVIFEEFDDSQGEKNKSNK